ncbi:uncharacterized protein VP01_606g1 [Puccinia sorghi]|uniref:Uncharacterized protein n=1 Tax=Puccinia sorghi TaxID=27349 RepID=A0A0L6UJB2_9BASI|nr:uncharacterized protein VP01_606g1 [Puccinia sorghi]
MLINQINPCEHAIKINGFFLTLLPLDILYFLLLLILLSDLMHAMPILLPKSLTHSILLLILFRRFENPKKMITNNSALNLPKSLPAGNIKCPVCAISKSTRSSKLLSSQRNPERLEIVAVDLIGPMEVLSYGKSKYVLTFGDIATGYGEAHLLMEKSEAAQFLINCCNLML